MSPKWIELTPEMKKFQEDHPCPVCGAVPVEGRVQAVEEYRMAPRDDEGRAMLYMPYEAGTTVALRYEKTAVCENGHDYFIDEAIREIENPRQGPPLLP